MGQPSTRASDNIYAKRRAVNIICFPQNSVFFQQVSGGSHDKRMVWETPKDGVAGRNSEETAWAIQSLESFAKR
jgi:hypothetical protein